MAIFDSNQPMSFAGVQFPTDSYEVHLSGRKHVHEYPHSPGGAPEKLGRALYEITVDALFDANLIPKQYQNGKLWPQGLDMIRRWAELQQTDTLVIPTIGEMPCFIVDYREKSSNMHLSGVKVSLSFLEDSSDSFLLNQIAVPSSGAIVEAGEYFKQQTAPLKLPILEVIANLYADVVAYRDSIGMFSAVFEAKLTGLLKMLSFADTTVKELQDPKNLLGYDALHELWKTAIRVANDTADAGATLRTYITKTRMSLSDVSIALYGDTSHASDLLTLNSISDPFSMPAGTRIRYYPSASTKVAA